MGEVVAFFAVGKMQNLLLQCAQNLTRNSLYAAFGHPKPLLFREKLRQTGYIESRHIKKAIACLLAKYICNIPLKTVEIRKF